MPLPLPGSRQSAASSDSVQPIDTARHRRMMRKYEIAYLSSRSDLVEVTRLVPAAPAFEDSVSAFARGTLLQTARGPAAVEDLLPGDTVITAEFGSQPILWRGSMTIIPDLQPPGHDHMRRWCGWRPMPWALRGRNPIWCSGPRRASATAIPASTA